LSSRSCFKSSTASSNSAKACSKVFMRPIGFFFGGIGVRSGVTIGVVLSGVSVVLPGVRGGLGVRGVVGCGLGELYILLTLWEAVALLLPGKSE
jgi:hypothetical protein